MKPLEQLENNEKGRLLFDLFPQEIPATITFIKQLSLTIREEEAHARKQWQDGIMTFDFWLSLLKQAEQVIAKYGEQLEKNSRLFSDQLFDGQISIYTVYCLMQFTRIRKHANQKFSLAVDLLFNP